MRIAFICGSQEAGRDGVGDYTAGFAAELRLQGHEVMIVGLRDKFAREKSLTERNVEGGAIPVQRLPSAMPWRECIGAARQQMERFAPEWVSLQFVCYTFHPRGMVYRLAGKLKPLQSGRKLHVMFHELWGGAQRGARGKGRLIGFLQKHFLLRFAREARPARVHTSNRSYQFLLQKAGVDAAVLPLFGSIPIVQNPSGWMDAELAKVGVTALNRHDFCILGIFGGIPPEWSAEVFLATIKSLPDKTWKRPLLITIGTHGADAERRLRDAGESLSDQAIIVSLGVQSEDRVSEFLSRLDFGVATAPWNLIGKSSAVAAMLEHGLPVLVLRDDVDLGLLEDGDPRCIKLRGDWAERIGRTSKLKPQRNRPEVVRQFIHDLSVSHN